MPAPASYSNTILIPGRRGDLGLHPLIRCVTGSILPGTYLWQQKHTARRKGKIPQMGKHKGYPEAMQRQQTALWFGKNQIWDRALGFCAILFSLGIRQAQQPSKEWVTTAVTPRADTFESLSSFLAVELWEEVVVGKGWDANLILHDKAPNVQSVWREGESEKYLCLPYQAILPTQPMGISVLEFWRSTNLTHICL